MERYFYLNSNNEQVGPILPSEFSRHGVTETTMVWKQGMPNWMRAGQIPELSQYFKPSPPPPVGNNNFNGGNLNGGEANNFYGNYNGNNFGGSNQYKPAKPDNNMVWAVLSTLLCCVPLGVYSIVQASKVNSFYESGQYNEAQKAADEAKKWAMIGAVSGFIASILYTIIMIATS